MRLTKQCLSFLALALLVIVYCGGGENEEACVVGSSTGCEEGLICETIVGAEKPGCFAPIQIVGKVFNSSDKAGIVGATIVALSSKGAARTTVVTSGEGGAYTLPILVPRDKEGKPQKELVTLRVAALLFQPFPTAPRTALPLEIDQAVKKEKSWVLQNAATDVALLALPNSSAKGKIEGVVSIEGKDNEKEGGVLVVAEVGGKAVSTAISDLEGKFTIFNLPTGAITLKGFRQHLNVKPLSVTLSGAELKDVKLQATKEGLAKVTGSISFADAPGGSKTSVLLVVESTFDEKTRRGESPMGLRAGDVTGSFTIEGVPPGRYVVLAAFENDGLVQDPDQNIGGTSLVRIEVKGSDVSTGESFKITGALKVLSPGGSGLEVIQTAQPTLKWQDDSSEDGYDLVIYDAFGNIVHEKKGLPRVTGSDSVTYQWSNAQLKEGMIYQFKVVSWRNKGKKGRSNISTTEDLLGVFLYQK